ncbi:MAG: hypothetical protein A3E80_00710 [Chlamydiae bacterium RIFCSPHIGHO2_12_FULL_49_9]|nr:MAG: hypothetical protein A3E80_00710 [Chlamydiae bacterium RIFCSPHIGHO2_12_FULL_49_9]
MRSFISWLLAANLTLQIGDQLVDAEIADTNETRQTGLMNRDHLEEGTGMLFVFEKPQILSFWMKDTKIPLSIAFFDAEKKLLNTADMDPYSNSLCHSLALAKYALEVPRGWFARHEIRRGMKFSFHDHPLSGKMNVLEPFDE